MQLHKKYLILLCFILITITISTLKFKIYQQNQTVRVVQLNKLQAKWTLVNVWAKWCSSCLQEIQALNKLNLKEKNLVQVYGYSMDNYDVATLKQLKAKFDIQYPLLTNNLFTKNNIELADVVPQTYIFSKDGTVKKILLGPKSYAEFVKEIELLESANNF